MNKLSAFTEGDYLRTLEGLFFAVKGGVHPVDKVIAYLRYVPDPLGERSLGETTYRRVIDIDETTRYLQCYYPAYLNYIGRLNMTMQSVPVDCIAEIYRPRERLKVIMNRPTKPLEEAVTKFVEAIIGEGGVQKSSFGVSGSLLIGLDNETSDIDLNVYGQDEGRRVYDALKELRRAEEWISAYNDDTVKGVLLSRWGELGPLKELAEIEKRKVLHGIVLGKDYFVRLLRDEESTYPSLSLGKVNIQARIMDSSESIFTPCKYLVREVDTLSGPEPDSITELMSYRGKFTEQAWEGELVKVRGNLEEVHKPDGTHFRLFLGDKGDYLLPLYPDVF